MPNEKGEKQNNIHMDRIRIMPMHIYDKAQKNKKHEKLVAVCGLGRNW